MNAQPVEWDVYGPPARRDSCPAPRPPQLGPFALPNPNPAVPRGPSFHASHPGPLTSIWAWALLAVAMGTLALAQEQRPLPRGSPEALIPPATVSIEVSEGLDPDRLRSLARPHVTAWMRTTSNTLAESTVENLQRFDVAWVELRTPLSVEEAAMFSKLPRAGAWGSLEAMEMARMRLPGSRRLAVNLSTPLDEPTFERLARLRPAVTRWTPPGPTDLLSWGLFRALGGRKVLVVTPELLRPVRCERRAPTEPVPEVHLAQLLAMNSEIFPCGRGARVGVTPETELWLLQSLLVRDPSVELVVSIGADIALASRAARLLEVLGLGAPR